MKLDLVHNDNKVVIMAASYPGNEVFKLRERAVEFVMAVRDDVLIINLDNVKRMPFCFLILQEVSHEFLHFISRYSCYTSKIIHKISRKTRGLIL